MEATRHAGLFPRSAIAHCLLMSGKSAFLQGNVLFNRLR